MIEQEFVVEDFLVDFGLADFLGGDFDGEREEAAAESQFPFIWFREATILDGTDPPAIVYAFLNVDLKLSHRSLMPL